MDQRVRRGGFGRRHSERATAIETRPRIRNVDGETRPTAQIAKTRQLRIAAPETKRTAGSEQVFRRRMAPRLKETAAVKAAPKSIARGCKPPIVTVGKMKGQAGGLPPGKLALAGGVF